MNRLKALRKKHNLTTEQLAEKTGIVRTTITAIEKGRRQLNANHARALADYFGVTTDYLLGRDIKNTADALLDQLEEITDKYFDSVINTRDLKSINIYLILQKIQEMTLKEIEEVLDYIRLVEKRRSK